MFNKLKEFFGIKPRTTKCSSSRASVSFMITRDMRQQLYDLGYTKHQVNTMSTVKASAILQG